MLKAVGALMLILGCVGIGLLRVKTMDKRIETVRSLMYAFEVMERELTFRIPLLEEMLSSAARLTEEPTRSFLSICKNELIGNTDMPFAEIWNRAAQEQLTTLKKKDLNPVLVLGSFLGRYDSEGQRNAINQAYSALEQVLSNATKERSGQGKVYKVLGATAGAFLAILLL